MDLSDLNIKKQLIIILSSIMLFVIVLGIVALSQNNRLFSQTEIMYTHPLQARRAIGNIVLYIRSMQLEYRHMLLAEDEAQIEAAIHQTEEYEARVAEEFQLLYDRYMGPQSDIEEAYDLFDHWVTIRENNRELARTGQISEAMARVTDLGDIGLVRKNLLASLEHIDHILEIRADNLFQQSEEIRAALRNQLLIILLAIMALSLIIYYLLYRNIRKPLNEIGNATNRFKQGYLSARSTYVSKNEFGLLSDAFNDMATEIQSSTRKLESQNRELEKQKTELERQKEKITVVSQLKTSFISNMSHELRTPLNSIITLSGVLERRLDSQISEEEQSYLEIIKRNGTHLLGLINDFLDFSRLETGKEETEIDRFDLNAVIDDIVFLQRPQAEQKGIALSFTRENDHVLIESDSGKCQRILHNLIANAIKFTPEGHVEITTSSHPSHIDIHVKDTGIGIAKEKLSYVFEEFRQADSSTSRHYGGTGLGLSIAKRYAELLGGNILVESEPGKGSVFTLRLPLK